MTKKICFVLVLFLGLWFAGFVLFMHKIYNVQNIEKGKADAIVVLTGGRNRLSGAVKLLNSQKAEKMFVSGVFKDTSMKELQNRSDVEFFNSEKVVLDKKSTNTLENAIESAQWIEQYDIKSIYLVTSNYHMPRSMIEFHHYNPKLDIIPYPVYSDKVSREWWKSWGSFKLLIGEYNKFLYVLFRDGLSVKKEN